MIHKLCKTASLAATSFVSESPLFLLDCLLRFLRVAVLLSLWRAILAGRGTVSGMDQASVLTYTLIAEVFAEQIGCRTRVEIALWEGTIATRLLQPLGLVSIFAAEAAGRWLIGFGLVSIPLLLCAPLLGVDPLPASPAAAGLFVLSLLLAVAVGLAIDFLFAAVVIVLGSNVWIIETFRRAVGAVLSGAMLPLALLPWGLGGIFGWLPFAAMASAPLRIYTGAGSPWPQLAMQAAWAVALWPAARWAWSANRERLVSYGG